jgi:HemY protein
MTALFLIFIALALSAGIVAMVMEDPGYVLITIQPWSIELSLALFLLLIFVLFLVLYLVVRGLAKMWGSPHAVNQWRAGRTQDKARQLQTRGIMQVIEGDWEQAERHLLSYISATDTPALSYLGAAHAAQGRGDFRKRDEYLAQAIDSDPDQTTAIGLTQATLQYRSGQYEQAGNTLKRLRNRAPKNKRVLGLSVKVLEQTQDWQTLHDILPSVRKQKAAPELEIDRLLQLSSRRLLTHAEQDNELNQTWRSLSREERNNPELLATFAQRLMDQGLQQQTEELVRKSIQRKWDPNLVRLYGRIRSDNPAAQIKYAEKWTADHKDSPELMLSLAQISLNNELWGKARSYLEACIECGGTVEAYRELGHLLEQLDEKDTALDLYRRGIDQATPRDVTPAATPEVPADSTNPVDQTHTILDSETR